MQFWKTTGMWYYQVSAWLCGGVPWRAIAVMSLYTATHVSNPSSSSTRKCRTLWGRAWASSYYGYMHMNRLSFTLKWWAELFMSVVYARPLPEVISTWRVSLVLSASSLPLMVLDNSKTANSCCDKQEVRCHVCLNLSRLCYGSQRCTLAVAQHCPSPLEAT